MNERHKMITVWLTGLSGSGKSTISSAVYESLQASKMSVYVIDGDVVRTGLCSDLGFSPEDRKENVRRVAELCKILNEAGVLVIVALISPYQADRDMARDIVGDKFREVYIKTPLEECEMRDPKGLYKKARTGEIKNFTGISAPYEEPKKPDLIVDTYDHTPDECAQYLRAYCWAQAK